MKHSRRRTRRRRQKGGAFEIGQRYIADPERHAWVEALYPLSGVLLVAFKQIDWSDYAFDGVTEKGVWDDATEETVIKPRHIRAVAEPIPYKILGGAACDIYGKAFPAGPKVWRYVEPTADLDARMAYPRVTEVVGHDDELMTMIYNRDHLTALGEHYTRWLFDQVSHVLGPLAALIERIGPQFVRMDPPHDPETAMADMHRHVGKLLITRSPMPQRNMVKIQAGVGVRTPARIIYSHFLELIFYVDGANPTSVNNEDQRITTTDVMRLDDVFVEAPLPYMNTHFRVLGERVGLPNVYNHYGRVKYMIHLIAYLARRGSINIWERPGVPHVYIRNLLKNADRLDDPRSCPPPAFCDRAGTLAPLLRLLES